MQTEEVEAALARLMPPALSENCQFELESMIDELAGPEEIVEMPVHRPVRWLIAGGIAASVAGLFAVFAILQPSSEPAITSAKAVPAGIVLVGETDRVESMKDEGWRDADGTAMQALRLNFVAENRLRDEETGIVMQVSEPREELLLTPISTF